MCTDIIHMCIVRDEKTMHVPRKHVALISTLRFTEIIMMCFACKVYLQTTENEMRRQKKL